MKTLFLTALLTAVIGLTTPCNADLVKNGGGLIYDTVLNITWLQDANYAKTSGYSADGKMTWGEAMTWVAGLDINGTTGWRLPVVNGPADTGSGYSGTSIGYNVPTTSGSPPYPAVAVYSEMASMFYDTLGNKAQFDTSGNTQEGYGLTNTGPFYNLMSYGYWNGQLINGSARDFWFSSADQGVSPTWYTLYAWAVHDGDIGPNGPIVPTPIPGAVWLLGSGLIGLIGIRINFKK